MRGVCTYYSLFTFKEAEVKLFYFSDKENNV